MKTFHIKILSNFLIYIYIYIYLFSSVLCDIKFFKHKLPKLMAQLTGPAIPTIRPMTQPPYWGEGEKRVKVCFCKIFYQNFVGKMFYKRFYD